MNKNIKTVLTLFLISGLSGLLLNIFNNFTAERIEKNYTKKIEKIAKSVFVDTTNIDIISISGYDFVVSEVKCYNNDNVEIGSLFEAKGNNKFGNISLLVAIENNCIKEVKILSMKQSYGKTAKSFIEKTFSDDLAFEYVEGLDLKCGATYSAELIKSLVSDVIKVYGDRYEG